MSSGTTDTESGARGPRSVLASPWGRRTWRDLGFTVLSAGLNLLPLLVMALPWTWTFYVPISLPAVLTCMFVSVAAAVALCPWLTVPRRACFYEVLGVRILRLSTQMGEKSPVRGFHANMVAGALQPVSSGLAGWGSGAAAAIPGVTAARLHSQPGRAGSVTAVGMPSNGRLAALISLHLAGRRRRLPTGGSGRTGVCTRYPPIWTAPDT